jgi:hypothetical protein
MDTSEILAHIDAEISRLQHVKSLLGGAQPFPRAPKVKTKQTKRVISAEGRARIAAAQKARWAKTKRGK